MFATAIIVFREVLEASLLVGIVAAATRAVPGAQPLARGAEFLPGLAGSALVALFTERHRRAGERHRAGALQCRRSSGSPW